MAQSEMLHAAAAASSDGDHGGTRRRDFLKLVTGSFAVVGAGAIVWPFTHAGGDPGGARGAACRAECVSAWNRDPVGGVIGVQKGPL